MSATVVVISCFAGGIPQEARLPGLTLIDWPGKGPGHPTWGSPARALREPGGRLLPALLRSRRIPMGAVSAVYSAIVMLGIGNDGLLYVEADLARRPTTQIVADGVAWCRRFQPDAIGIEANQFQDLLGGQFEAELAAQGVLGTSPWLINNRINKLVRVRRLGPYLETHRFRFKNTPSTRILVDQLRTFPIGDHDDGPDALEMAIRLAARLTNHPYDDGLGDQLRVSG